MKDVGSPMAPMVQCRVVYGEWKNGEEGHNKQWRVLNMACISVND